jgi:hypothetical protein
MNRGFRAFYMAMMIAVMLVAGQRVGVKAETQKGEDSESVEPKASESSRDSDIIMLDNQGYRKDRKGPVEFTHKKHALDYKVLCWECHHDYKDEQIIWVPWAETKKCSECHDPVKKEPTDIRLQRAFHYNCKGCHAALEKENKKAGEAKKCTGCHVKKQ